MKTKFFFFLAICFLAVSCNTSNTVKNDDFDSDVIVDEQFYTSDDTEYAEPNDMGGYGDMIEVEQESVTPTEMASVIDADGGYSGLLEGNCTAVCAKKGCWISMADDEQEVFVQFKDYGFFLPRDIEDMQVKLLGNGYWDTTSVADLQHYAEDAGDSQEEIDAITEPEVELKFEATGAVVMK